jgi:hypothetical protein
VELLLDGSEEAVQVYVQEGESVGMGGDRHRLCGAIIFAFYLPSITS